MTKGSVDYGGTWVRISLSGIKSRSLKTPSVPAAKLPNLIKSTLDQWKVIPLDQLKVGAKGVWKTNQKKTLALKLSGSAKKIVILSDVEMAYESLFGTKRGILLIAGTGSIAYGKNSGGRWARAGGLGPKIGDEGSGYWIGKEFLKRKLGRNADIRSVRKTASLAKKIIQQSKNKKSIQNDIVSEAKNHLADLVLKVFNKLHVNQPVPLGFSGGLFRSSAFKRAVSDQIKKRLGIKNLRLRTANTAF